MRSDAGRLGNQRVAVVTGGAQGIGAAISVALVNDGFRVAILDVHLDLARQTARRIDESGNLAAAISCDVTGLADIERAAQVVENEFGPIYALVNNVGWSPNRPFIELESPEWSRIIDLNFISVLNACHVVLPGMLARRRGRIISIASDAARVGTPKETVYAGAKAAVIGFSKALAVEVSQSDITVNVVSPGTTDTPLLRQILTEEQIERRIRANPMRRIGRAEDVAAAVSYFASDAASYVTGQVLSVNGGMSRIG